VWVVGSSPKASKTAHAVGPHFSTRPLCPASTARLAVVSRPYLRTHPASIDELRSAAASSLIRNSAIVASRSSGLPRSASRATGFDRNGVRPPPRRTISTRSPARCNGRANSSSALRKASSDSVLTLSGSISGRNRKLHYAVERGVAACARLPSLRSRGQDTQWLLAIRSLFRQLRARVSFH